MKNERLEFLTKLGPKSQIVLRKDIRLAIGARPGSIVRTRLENKHVIIEPFDVKEEIAKVEGIAKKVAKKWPKGLSAVEAIRRERE